MTATFQTTNLIGAGPQFTFAAAGDLFHILGGVTVARTNAGDAVTGSHGNQSLRIDGTLASDGKAAQLLGGTNDVTIGRTGVVVANEPSAGNHGIFLNGSGNVLTNDGAISALTTHAVLVDQAHVTNRGTIDGAQGVLLGLIGAAGSNLVNAGTITANAFDDANRGTRNNNGVYTEGDDTRIVNAAGGVIAAVSGEGAGVRIGSVDTFTLNNGNGSTVLNRGEIHALRHVGIDASELFGGAGVTVTNFGLVAGGDGSVSLSQNADVLVNRGTLDGDVLLGAGADSFDGRNGEVLGSVLGGAGDDTYLVSDPDIALVELAGEGTDTVRSLASFELPSGIENLSLVGDADIDAIGNGAANVIAGNNGDNVLLGGGGADTISGRAGNDRVVGGAGDDRLVGGEGDDILNGGAGADVLSGGDGDDVFAFATVADSAPGAVDRIVDFTRGEDRIHLGRIDADPSTAADDAFVFIGINVAFSGTAGELRTRAIGGGVRVEADTDGDAIADFLVITNGALPVASDFIL